MNIDGQTQKDKVFLGYLTAQKTEYTKTHKVFNSTWEELKDFFDACTTSYKASGKYQDLAIFCEANIIALERKSHGLIQPYKSRGKPRENGNSRSTCRHDKHKTASHDNSY